jgi:hypothetical protein
MQASTFVQEAKDADMQQYLLIGDDKSAPKWANASAFILSIKHTQDVTLLIPQYTYRATRTKEKKTETKS